MHGLEFHAWNAVLPSLLSRVVQFVVVAISLSICTLTKKENSSNDLNIKGVGKTTKGQEVKTVTPCSTINSLVLEVIRLSQLLASSE